MKKLFSITVTAAIVLGGLAGLWVGNTMTGILSGTASGFLVAWLATTNWVGAWERTLERYTRLRAFLRLTSYRKKKAAHKRAYAEEAIQQVTERRLELKRLWRLLLLAPKADRVMPMIAFTFLLVAMALVGLQSLSISAMLTILAVAPVLVFVAVLTVLKLSHPLARNVQVGSQSWSRAGFCSELIRNVSEQPTVVAQHAHVENALNSAHECAAEWTTAYLAGKRSLLATVVLLYLQSLANVLLFPLALLMFVCYGVFVFANHETRIKAAVAGLVAFLHLSVNHFFLGGILWESANFWLSLGVAALAAGFIAGYLCQGKARPLGDWFQKPAMELVKL